MLRKLARFICDQSGHDFEASWIVYNPYGFQIIPNPKYLQCHRCGDLFEKRCAKSPKPHTK